MIAAYGVTGEKYAVLGLGRSGLSAAKSLVAGGADVIVWDDGESARERAELLGLRVIGSVKCYQGGHELTNMFLRKL